LIKVPKIEEDLSYERIFAEKLSGLTTSYQTEMPSFESPSPIDPAFRILSELAMTELMIRARINAAATAQLLRYSEDLDFLLFGMRRDGESLEAFRERIRLNLHLASPAGPLEMYRSLALAAANEGARTPEEFQIVDAFAETAQDKVVLHLQPNSRLAVDMPAVLKKVTNFLNLEHIKPAFDLVEVKAATPKRVNVSGTARLSRGNGSAFLKGLTDNLSASLLTASCLGWSLPLSWIYAQLHVPGVESVSILTPIADIPVGKSEYIVPGSIVINLASA
jgi:phage-related baseplate assembly protein